MNAQRLEAIRDRLHKLRLHALLITFLPHIRYLTGFSGTNGLCLILPRKQFFLTDGRYTTQAREEVRGFQILIAKKSLGEEAKKRGVLPSGARIGFEVEHMNVAELQNWKTLYPRMRFVPTRTVVEALCAVKDESEIDLIRRAVSISDDVFRKILDVLRPGISEMDVAAEIIYLHRKLGAEADAFEPIVASGFRGALPHARATGKSIKRGEMVTLDFGCRYRGYHSDLTRTVAVGKPTDRARRMYRIVREAQQRAVDSARSGMAAKDLDAVARKHITRAGFGRWFPHSLGHGLGIQVHEAPRVSASSKDVLKSGNVITIEPGVYVPSVGGVRIEDDVVIRNGFCEILNAASKELVVL
ncbi:MAG: aminopeptidase P family protein [Ignavibacteriales bacterium]|nr:aminopeptidase P family protein [Ignavibacteriales bacterium]